MTDRQERIDLAHEAYDRIADQDVGMGTIIEAIVDALDIEPMEAGEDGWSDWAHPVPGYLMQCCDCRLVHEVEFKVVESKDDAPLNPGESDEGVIVFRMRRHGEEPIRPEEILPGMRYEGTKVDRQAVLENRRRIDPELPVELADGHPRKIIVNHGTWFETSDGGAFDQFGKSLTGFDSRTYLRNVR